jgi:hypothetical protein
MNVWTAIQRTLVECWLVTGQMAPYLLLGFLVAGVLSVCVSPAWVERHLGGRGLRPVFTASLLGVPLPLCSCGVIPVAASIRRHGASRAATSAFLLSTPQTGVDSIAVTYALLGPVFAVYRPLAALLTGIVGGVLVRLFGEDETTSDLERQAASQSTPETDPSTDSRHRNVVFRALRYGLVTLPRDIGPALLLGILVAGALSAMVPQDRLGAYVGGGLLSMLVLMAVGIPLYVCATASVPIAAGLIHLGASPGAALAFLIAGPATNTATIATVWKVMGRRTAFCYLGTVAVSAVGCGLLLDRLIPAVQTSLPHLGHHAHAMGAGGWLNHAAAVALLAVLLFSYYDKVIGKRRDAAGGVETADAAAGGEPLELWITGMKCTHCADTIRRALAEEEGVESAEVDLDRGRAVVVGENLDRSRLTAAVVELGYAVRSPDEASRSGSA